MPRWVCDAYSEYVKRFPSEYRLCMHEIAIEKRNSVQKDLTPYVKREGEHMLAKISPQSHVIALEVQGQAWSTEEVAQRLANWQQRFRRIAFLIGGPDGLAPTCLAAADEKWSLSRLTLPHPLVRIVLIEQLYRAWSINNHHPYHRG